MERFARRARSGDSAGMLALGTSGSPTAGSLTWDVGSCNEGADSDWGYFVDMTPRSVDSKGTFSLPRSLGGESHIRRTRSGGSLGSTGRSLSRKGSRQGSSASASDLPDFLLHPQHHHHSHSHSNAHGHGHGQSNRQYTRPATATNKENTADNSSLSQKSWSDRLSSDLLFKDPSEGALDALDGVHGSYSTHFNPFSPLNSGSLVSLPGTGTGGDEPSTLLRTARVWHDTSSRTSKAGPHGAKQNHNHNHGHGHGRGRGRGNAAPSLNHRGNLDTDDMQSAQHSAAADAADVADADTSTSTSTTTTAATTTGKSSPVDISQSPRRRRGSDRSKQGKRSASGSTAADAEPAEIAAAIAQAVRSGHSADCAEAESPLHSVASASSDRHGTRSRSVSAGKHFTIPKVQIGADGNVKYLVQLHEPGKEPRHKWTRFSSFHKLKDRIKMALPRNVAAQFPRRYWKWFVNHSTNKFVENRRGELEQWLQQAVDFLSCHSHLNTQHSSYFAAFVAKFETAAL